MNNPMWEKIVGEQGPSFQEWAGYFVENYPEELKGIDLIDRFNAPRSVGKFQDRAGIVFSADDQGRNVPVGIIVYHGNEDGHFIYHQDYLNSDGIILSTRVPKRSEPIPLFPKIGKEREPNLQAFIANRGAEGWNSYLQAVSLGQLSPVYLEDIERDDKSPKAKTVNSPPAQLERLLTFGRDIPGAFWVLDVDLDPEVEKAHNQIIRKATIAGRNALAGAQPKLPGVHPKDGNYYPTRFQEEDRTTQLSTHIFKIATQTSGNQGVAIAEYFATKATKTLLPGDKVVDINLVNLTLSDDAIVPAVAVSRFDRPNKKGRRYPYYISRRLTTDTVDQVKDGWRLPGQEIERTIAQAVRTILNDHHAVTMALQASGVAARHIPAVLQTVHEIGDKPDNTEVCIKFIERVDLQQDGIHLKLSLDSLMAVKTHQVPTITRDIPMRMKRRGIEMRLVIGNTSPARKDMTLIRTAARAHEWFYELASGHVQSLAEIASHEGIHKSDVTKRLALAFLAPELIEAIIEGQQPPDLVTGKLVKHIDLPTEWSEQKRVLGFA